MQDPDQAELEHRLGLLAPFFRDLGVRVLETYARAGILAAMPANAFPVSDAVFTHKGNGYACHPHGPVYFSITREGVLELAGQGAGVPVAEAIRPYAQVARREDLEEAGPMEGATEWFPPPRFLLDPDTDRLYIGAVAGIKRPGPLTHFIPVEQYVEERARLFAGAFRAAL